MDLNVPKVGFPWWDCDWVLQGKRRWGLAMFSGVVQETLNRFEKHAHNKHSARGGGSLADDGLVAGNLWQQSAVNRESAVLEQCLGWAFVYFDIHVLVHGCVRASGCRAREALEVKVAHPALHRPSVFVTDGTTPGGTEPRSGAGHPIGLIVF